MKKRIEVLGTGSQAPYGINEIIDDFPDTENGFIRAKHLALSFYKPAEIVVPGKDEPRYDKYEISISGSTKYDYLLEE